MSARVRPFDGHAEIFGAPIGGDNWQTPPWLLELLFPDGRYFDPLPINPVGLRVAEGGGAWPTDIPIFLNPPYSDPRPWLARAAAHAGPVTCLVKDDPSASWWDFAVIGQFQVVHIGQRLRFVGARQSANFPSAVWRRLTRAGAHGVQPSERR